MDHSGEQKGGGWEEGQERGQGGGWEEGQGGGQEGGQERRGWEGKPRSRGRQEKEGSLLLTQKLFKTFNATEGSLAVAVEPKTAYHRADAGWSRVNTLLEYLMHHMARINNGHVSRQHPKVLLRLQLWEANPDPSDMEPSQDSVKVDSLLCSPRPISPS